MHLKLITCIYIHTRTHTDTDTHTFLMVTTNQKSIIDMQMKKKNRKKPKRNTKDSHQIIKEQKNYENNPQTTKKMAVNAFLFTNN